VHNSPFEVLASELNRVRQCEPRLREGTQRSEVVLFGIGNDGGDAWVCKDDLREELADCNRPQSQSGHRKFPYGEVDTSRSEFRLYLYCMLRVIRPEIPLNPPNWPSTMLHHENMRGLNAVNPRAVFRLNTRQIEALTPPRIHVGGGEPLSKQRKVRSA
jgi:hypothetical protein